jgi:chemotaxis signal transduction protein
VGADLKNVIVFTLGGVRQAAELRWVREVITLGFVTAVPTAPPGIAGAFNLRGHLVPVLDIAALDPRGPGDRAPGPAPRQGDGALLVEIDGITAALRVDKVEEVATLTTGEDGAVIDGRGRPLALIDPPALVRRAVADSHAVRGADDPVVADPNHG